jgi:hypothetical protein
MATHNDTDRLIDYKPSTYPTLGKPERYLSTELDKINLSIRSIIAVMQLLEDRMNSNGLS